MLLLCLQSLILNNYVPLTAIVLVYVPYFELVVGCQKDKSQGSLLKFNRFGKKFCWVCFSYMLLKLLFLRPYTANFSLMC